MDKRLWLILGTIFLVLVTLFLAGWFYLSSQQVTTVTSSASPGWKLELVNNSALNLFTGQVTKKGLIANTFSSSGTMSSEQIQPKLLGIVLTDRFRSDNVVTENGRSIYSSWLTKVTADEAILYIWADESELFGQSASKNLTAYILDTIKWYQTKDNHYSLNLGAKLMEWIISQDQRFWFQPQKQ